MMTREEVAEIITYCKDRGITYKSRLIELGIPEWKFFDSKARYAKEQAESQSAGGEFLQLSAGGAFVPMPSFASATGRKPKSKKSDTQAQMMSIELKTPGGTLMRIQGEFDASFLKAIIQGS